MKDEPLMHKIRHFEFIIVLIISFRLPRLLMLAVFIALAAYIIYDVLLDYPQNAISIAGLALYIIIFYVFSKNPAKVFSCITESSQSICIHNKIPKIWKLRYNEFFLTL